MSDAPAESKPEAAASGGGGGGGSKVVLILTALNVLITAGLGGVMFVSFQKEKVKPRAEDIVTDGDGHGSGSGSGSGHGSGSGSAPGSKKKNTDFGKMIPLEQFVVNLSTPGGSNPKFFRLNAALEVPNDDTEAEVNSKIPQIRNAIIDLINSKRASDVATVEGRDYLKEEIRNALNGFMVNGKVKGVFFTSFSVSN